MKDSWLKKGLADILNKGRKDMLVWRKWKWNYGFDKYFKIQTRENLPIRMRNYTEIIIDIFEIRLGKYLATSDNDLIAFQVKTGQ